MCWGRYFYQYTVLPSFPLQGKGKVGKRYFWGIFAQPWPLLLTYFTWWNCGSLAIGVKGLHRINREREREKRKWDTASSRSPFRGDSLRGLKELQWFLKVSPISFCKVEAVSDRKWTKIIITYIFWPGPPSLALMWRRCLVRLKYSNGSVVSK